MYCIVNFNTRGAVGQLITQEMTTGDSMLGKVVVARSGKRESRERDWACAITTPTDRLDWNSPTEWRWNAERHSTRGTQFSLSLLFDSPFLRSIIRLVSHSPSFLIDVRIHTKADSATSPNQNSVVWSSPYYLRLCTQVSRYPWCRAQLKAWNL
jgi:hypothetical protein